MVVYESILAPGTSNDGKNHFVLEQHSRALPIHKTILEGLCISLSMGLPLDAWRGRMV
jgi:hypothetical protein